MSSKPTIAEMNRDLRNFRDSEHTKHAEKFYDQHPEMCRYDCSYDWLMPVWQKFKHLYDVKENTKITGDWIEFTDRLRDIENAILNKPITEAHRLIWEGVKWLETIKNK